MLERCHRRLEETLATLAAPSRQAVDEALAFIDRAVKRHEDDEEASLFPRLRDVNSPEARQAMAKLDALESDHVRADAAHAEMDVLGLRWLQDGRLAPEKRQRMRELLNELRELYRGHIEIEDREVFPLAARVLSPDQVDQVGQEMAERRGLSK